MRKTVYIVHTAQFYESSGELLTFARAFPTLKDAAKFVVADYNEQCRIFDDPNTLSDSAWKGISKTLRIESPGEIWSGWLVWNITKQVLSIG